MMLTVLSLIGTLLSDILLALLDPAHPADGVASGSAWPLAKPPGTPRRTARRPHPNGN